MPSVEEGRESDDESEGEGEESGEEDEEDDLKGEDYKQESSPLAPIAEPAPSADLECIVKDIRSCLSPQPASPTTLTEADLSKRIQILDREALVEFFDQLSSALSLQPQAKHGGRVCVGMVGYPNVGKSSVINTLLNVSKNSHGHRVSVSSTPGRTKHLQTFMLTDSIMLCDCPGLVFPSFMATVGDMLLSGVLPINNMRNYIEPAAALACRVPQHVLEAVYGLQVKRELDIFDAPDRPPNAFEMLGAYCAVRGYVTNGTGRWVSFFRHFAS